MSASESSAGSSKVLAWAPPVVRGALGQLLHRLPRRLRVLVVLVRAAAALDEQELQRDGDLPDERDAGHRRLDDKTHLGETQEC